MATDTDKPKAPVYIPPTGNPYVDVAIAFARSGAGKKVLAAFGIGKKGEPQFENRPHGKMLPPKTSTTGPPTPDASTPPGVGASSWYGAPWEWLQQREKKRRKKLTERLPTEGIWGYLFPSSVAPNSELLLESMAMQSIRPMVMAGGRTTRVRISARRAMPRSIIRQRGFVGAPGQKVPAPGYAPRTAVTQVRRVPPQPPPPRRPRAPASPGQAPRRGSAQQVPREPALLVTKQAPTAISRSSSENPLYGTGTTQRRDSSGSRSSTLRTGTGGGTATATRTATGVAFYTGFAGLNPLAVATATSTRTAAATRGAAAPRGVSVGRVVLPSPAPWFELAAAVGGLTPQRISQLQRTTGLATALLDPAMNPAMDPSSAIALQRRSPGSAVDDCECEKPKKRKPRQPRAVCKSGTYRQTARGVKYSPKSQVPCT